MKPTAIITRPCYDLATNYLYHWAQLVINIAKKKGNKIYDLSKKKVIKKNFWSYLKQNPNIIFFNGHGSDKSVCGHDDETLIDTNNKNNLKNKIIYARSCSSGKYLAKHLVSNNQLDSFIGYEEEFVIRYDLNSVIKPTKDKIASLFLKTTNLIPQSLLKGHTAKEAHKKGKKAMYDQLINLMTDEDQTIDNSHIIATLWHDIKHQVLITQE